MRLELHTVPFSRLFIVYTIGYYNTDGRTQIEFNRSLSVDIDITDNTLELFCVDPSVLTRLPTEITVSPAIMWEEGTDGFRYGIPGSAITDGSVGDIRAIKVNAPYIETDLLVMECRIIERQRNSIIAKIVNINVDEGILDSEGNICIEKMFGLKCGVQIHSN